jgi:hypothetical protein
MTRIVSIVVVICLATPAFAQTALPVVVDQRVRISAADATHVGRVVAVAADSLRISIDNNAPVSIATPTIRKVEVSRGRESKVKKYATRGAIISGLIGAILLPVQRGESGSSVGKAVALGAWSGGLFGGLIGGAIGAAKGADRWEQVWP